MQSIVPAPLLRFALVVDAAASGALALLQIVAAGQLAPLLGLPHGLALGSGVFLAAYAALLVALARCAALPRALVMLIVLGNLGWALACAALATVQPELTALGVGYLALQAAAVCGFAFAQWLGLQRSRPAAQTTVARA